MDRMKRVSVKEQDPNERITNFDEVCLGYTEEEAIEEAKDVFIVKAYVCWKVSCKR